MGVREAGKEANRRRGLLRWGVVGLALLVAVVAWLATRDGGGDSESIQVGTAPRVVSVGELKNIAASADHSIFWLGPMEGQELEVSEGEGGSAVVRYLKDGVAPGGEPDAALAIGSYPMEDPTTAVDSFAEGPGAIVREANDGRKVVSSVAKPSSVYFASPHGSVQVEVYDASPQRAMAIAMSAQVTPVR